MNKKRISISKCLNNGNSMWRVRWHDAAGKIRRKFFKGRDEAETFASQIRVAAIDIKQHLNLLTPTDLEKLALIHDEAQRRGVDLLAFLSKTEEVPKSPPNGVNSDQANVVSTKSTPINLSAPQIVGCLPQGYDLDTLLTVEQFAAWHQTPVITVRKWLSWMPGAIRTSRKNVKIHPRTYLELSLKKRTK